MSKSLFDAWTAKYDRWFETPRGRLVKKYESELLLKMVDPHPREKILDAGCGTGIFTLEVMSFRPIITGIDISRAMLLKAVEKTIPYNFTAVCTDMSALPFPDNYFDKVVSMTAIEFIKNAKQVITELNRVTRKGGSIIVTTLNSLSPWAEQRLRKAKDGHPLFQNIFFRSPDDMRSLVPVNLVVKTSIHFLKEDPLEDAPKIEYQGQKNGSDTGAFLAVKWNKY